jgi:hypothetical protein
MNKLITWNQLRDGSDAKSLQSILGEFPHRMGSGEIHSLAVADWSPEVDISEDDHGACSRLTCLK